MGCFLMKALIRPNDLIFFGVDIVATKCEYIPSPMIVIQADIRLHSAVYPTSLLTAYV